MFTLLLALVLQVAPASQVPVAGVVRDTTGAAIADSKSIHDAMDAMADDAELEDIQIIDLVEAFRKIAETVNFERLGEHKVTYDDTPIELHAEDIVDRLKRHASGGRSFSSCDTCQSSSIAQSSSTGPSRKACSSGLSVGVG